MSLGDLHLPSPMPQPPSWMVTSVKDSGPGQVVCESRDHCLLLIGGYVPGRPLPRHQHGGELAGSAGGHGGGDPFSLNVLGWVTFSNEKKLMRFNTEADQKA